MGLKTDIYNAKIESARVTNPDFDEAYENEDHPKHKATMKVLEGFDIEAEFMTEAIKNLLNHPDFGFRVTNLKASVKLEKLKLTEDLKGDIDMTRTVSQTVSQVATQKKGVDIVVDWIKKIKDVEVAGVKPLAPILGPLIAIYEGAFNQIKQIAVQSIPQTEGKNEITIPAFELREDGKEQGGFMDGYGHAYIGEEDIIPLSDTAVDPEDNDFTWAEYVKKDENDEQEFWS